MFAIFFFACSLTSFWRDIYRQAGALLMGMQSWIITSLRVLATIIKEAENLCSSK
jgi:hypothetical protein